VSTSAAVISLLRVDTLCRGDQREILRDEFDIDHAAGNELQIPQARRRLFLFDQLAHLGDIVCHLVDLSRLREHFPNNMLRFRNQTAVAADQTGPAERHVFPGPGFLVLILAE
jgi:hypothetical protein